MLATADRRSGGSLHRGRRLQRLLSLTSVLAFIFAAPGQVQAATKASQFLLGNGMEVVVVPTIASPSSPSRSGTRSAAPKIRPASQASRTSPST